MQELLEENTHYKKTNYAVVINPFDETKNIWVPTHHWKEYRFRVESTGTFSDTDVKQEEEK